MTRIFAVVAFLASMALGAVATANPPPPPPPPAPASTYVADRQANAPSYHFCTDLRLRSGVVVPQCDCYGRLDCQRVRPACTPLILATNPNAVRDGTCVMPRNAPPQG